MTSHRRPRPDPARVEADLEAFRRDLERETKASLRRDPERKRFAKAADPDVHRRRVRQQPWMAEP